MTEQQWRAAWILCEIAGDLDSQAQREYVRGATVDAEVESQVVAVFEELASGPSFPSAPDRRAGDTVGRYVLIERIGQGGMGEVYSAEDTELHRQVALKFLPSDLPSPLTASAQIIREARAASALNHPNIVTVYEILQTQWGLAIVMELVEGQSLRTLLKAGRLSRGEVIRAGRQIASALAAAHAKGIVHRDIKPENIMIRPDGYAKVMDFGLAQTIRERTASGNMPSLPVGTVRYMSPEQKRGEGSTGASDLYSLALVLEEASHWRHPVVTKLHNPQPELRPTAAMAASAFERLEQSERNAWIAAGMAGRWPISARWVAICLLVAGCGAAWYWRNRSLAIDEPGFRQITALVPDNRATAAAISADGSVTAYANADGIFIQAKNGETTPLRVPAHFIVDRLAWFANGTRLLASGFSSLTNVPAIWTISVTGAPPLLLRTHAREGVPSPDGTRVAFISQDRSEIWIVGADGEEPERIVAGPTQDTFPLVFWSPDGRRLAFQRRHYAPEHRDPNFSETKVEFDTYYERSYESVDLATGRTVAKTPEMWINSATALPDGRLLFLRWDPPRSNSVQLWEVKTNLATGAFLETPREIASPVEQNERLNIDGMSATADGKQILVLRNSGQNAVFVGDFSQSPPRIGNIRRLTLHERTDYPHAWTRDNRAVIFESNRRNGNYDLFKQDVDSRTAEPIVATPLTEILPQMGPDGRWVLYLARVAGGKHLDAKLMRVPLEGGTPEDVPIGGPLDEFRCALGGGKRCVLRTSVEGDFYAFHDLDPIQGKGRELARTNWMPGILGDWDVSPDGTQVAIPNHDWREARIRVVNFERGPNHVSKRGVNEHELLIPGLTDLRGLVWAADGHGWFVSVDTTVGNRLVYVWPDGRFQPLGDIPGWAVPSPDGRRVAFLNRIVASNAWILERH